MFKKLLVVFGVLLAGIVVLGCGSGDLPDGAVAKVGDTVITQEEFDQRMSDVVTQMKDQAPDKEQNPEEYQDLEARVLDYMITLEVSRQKADEVGAEVAQEDIDAQVDQIKQMFGGDEAKYQEALQGENITEEQLRQNIEEQLLIQAVAESVTKDVEVTDEEAQAYYDEHMDEFQQPETRTASHILFAPADNPDPGAQPTDADWEAALQEAQKVRKEIMDGADFAEMARQYSDDPGSKDQGGSLGEVQPGMMVPEFDEALFSLGKGEISEPVKTQYGYHLIKVEDIQEAKQLTFDEVKDQIKAQLLDQNKTTAWEDWMAKTREELGVVIAEGMETTTTTTAAGGSPDTSDDAATTTTAG